MKTIVMIAFFIVGAFAHQPDIRIESYTNSPMASAPQMHMDYGYHSKPVVPQDPPMQTNYGYQSPSTVTPLAPQDAPMQTNYGYQSQYNSQASLKPTAQIVRQHVLSDNAGNYNMQVESSDGSTQSETGTLKNLGNPEGPTSVKEGSYSWTSPEGQRFTLRYTADEKGFQPQGDHLPTSPPIPDEIQRSLATLPRTNEGSYSSYSAPAPASPPMNNHYGGYHHAPSADVPSAPSRYY